MRSATMYLSMARALGPGVSVVLIVLLARRNGPEEVGIYGLALAVFALLEAAASLGMRHLLPRELARGHNQQLLATGAALCLGAGLLLCLGLICISGLFVSPTTGHVLAVVALALPFSGLMVAAEGYWIATQHVGRLVKALVLEQAIRLVTGLVIVAAGYGAIGLMCCFVLGRLTAAVLARPPGGFSLARSARSTALSLMREIPIFVGLEACFQLYWRVDVLLLSLISSKAETGYYVAAYRIFSALLLLPQSYGQILLPRLVKSQGDGLFRRGIRDMAFLGGAMAVATILLARTGTGVLYGPGYQRSALILVILAMGLLPASVDQPQGRALVAAGRQSKDLAALAAATGTNICLNLLLIPSFGGLGAAWATIASLIVSVLAHRMALSPG